MGSRMTANQKILAKTEGLIGNLIFNNPERHNAVSLAMWQKAQLVIAAYLRESKIRVLVLSGAGGKSFVSGADISEFEENRSRADEVEKYDAITARVFNSLHSSKIPTIAMINGYCIGGGLALALSCDLRICSDTSVFGLPAARLGLGYSLEGMRRLMEVAGPAMAKEIAFSATNLNAQRAYAIGLANCVVPSSSLQRTVDDYAKRIARNAPLTLTAMKHAVNESLKDPDKRDISANEVLVRACFESEDYIEGRRAFMEKRDPIFSGK